MKKIVLIVLILLGFITVMFAQAGDTDNFYFRKHQPSILNKKVDSNLYSNHYLGDDIAFKMHVFKVMYTYIIKDESGVKKTVVRKPAIFHSLKKLDNNYKRKIKKGVITEDIAKKKLDNYLTVCFAVFSQTTDELEASLKQARDQNLVKNVFGRVVLE